MIPQDIIDDILRRVSIVDIIGQYVHLKKTGHTYKGLCPFHNDRNTPSLHISEQKGLYHCFSCGAGGNVLTFLKEYNKLDFIDSMKVLGEKVGIDVETYLNNQSDTLPLRNKIKTMHQIAQDFFHENLFNINHTQTETAVRIIKQRKLDKKTIILFGLGFGGIDNQGLYKLLQKNGFKLDEILSSGLCGQSEQGKIYDRFRNRITFPIHDGEGIIVAFGGRIIDQSSPAKYINSPDTPLFKKGSVLYGWHLAKENSLESGELILVEGYMDVIRMFQAGFSNTVAPLGTGLTEDRIQYLKHKVDKLIFCFDGDNAGQKSAYRSSGIAARLEVPARVAVLPENEDPDTFLLKHGPNNMAEIINNSQESIYFVIESAKKHLPNSAKFLQEVFEYAVQLENQNITMTIGIQTNQFLKKISEMLQVSFSSVELEFSRFRQSYFSPNGFIKENSQKETTKEFVEEFELIAILIMFPEFIDHVASIIDISDFYNSETKEIFTQMLLHPETLSQEWLIKAGNGECIQYTSKWLEAPDMRIIQNYAVSLRIKSLKKKRTLINNELNTQNSQTDRYYQLSSKIMEFQQELIDLKQKFYRL